MRLEIFLLWLLALAAGYSNGIVAWDYPVAGYQEGWSRRKLEAPPQPSVFFKEGDVLYGITPGDPVEKASAESKPDWLIWNETSGMMVAKDSWQALYLLAGKLRTDRLPMSPKVTLDVFEFPEGGRVAENAIPACSFSAVSRNGDQFTIKQTSGPWRIEAEGETAHDESKLQDDIRIDSTVSLTLSKGDERLEIRANVSSQAGGSVRLGRSVHHGHGLEVRAAFELLLPDGRVRTDDVFVEMDGKAQRLDRALVDATKTATGWFQSVRFSSQILELLAPGQDTDAAADPFADKIPANVPPKPASPFPLVDFPEEAGKWAGRPLWDLAEILRPHGVSLEPGDKMGYDPLKDQLCMFSKNQSQIDLVGNLLLACINYSRNLAVSVTDLTEELSITTKSRQKGFISHTKGEVVHSLEAEPGFGESESVLEVALEMHDGSPQNVFSATNIVWDGKQTPIGSAKVKGEAGTSWSLKAEVLPLEIHP